MVPVQFDAARLQRNQAHNAAQCRGLAGSVASNQADNRPARHFQCEITKHGEATDSDCRLLDFQHYEPSPSTCRRTSGWRNTASGGPSASTEPSANTMTRSAYRATISMSCSTKTVVIPMCVNTFTSASITPNFSCALTPLVGSSS